MLPSTATLALIALGTAINAQMLADRILNERTALPAGGWALTAPGGTCPASAPQCDAGWCCPNSLTCIAAGNADLSNLCCSGYESSNCLSALQASPACADDSWSLWNATETAFEFGFFCCLPDQAGLNTGACIAASQIPAYKNQLGVLLSAAPGMVTTTSSSATATRAGSSITSAASSTSSSVAASPTGKSNNAMSISGQGISVILLVQPLGAAFAVGYF